MSASTRRSILVMAAGALATAAASARTGGMALAEETRGTPSLRNAQIDAALRAATAAHELPGIVALAANDREIIYEGVFGTRRVGSSQPMTRDTVFRVASMVKTITSVAAMQLVERGKLALDEPVPPIDPVLSAPQVLEGFGEAGAPRVRPAKRPITLRHLLTHTSGLCYRLWDAEAIRYSNAFGALPRARRDKLPRTPLMFDPGERWEYGTSIDWVGRIVEAVSEQPLDAYFHEHILDPLGMSDTGVALSPGQRAREASAHKRRASGALEPLAMEPPTAPKKFSGGGGIYSSAPDYLTFIRMLLNDGSLNGVRVLKPETVALMGRNQIGDVEAGRLKTTAPAFSNDVDLFPGVSLRWGIGHMINMTEGANGRSAGSLTWGGLYNSYYWIDPKKRVAGVFMTQVLPFADRRALQAYSQFERGIYRGLKAA